MLCFSIQLGKKKIFRKNENGFQKNHFTTKQILTIHQIINRVHIQNLLFIDFSKAFDSIHRRKMKQILLAHGVQAKNLLLIDFSEAFDFIHRGKMEQILLAYCLQKKSSLLYKKNECNRSLTWWKHCLLWHSHKGFASKYINPIFVYTLAGLHTSNINRSNQRKWFQVKKR